MDSYVLKQVLIEQHPIKLPDEFVKRDILDDIFPLQKTPDIVVISGLRRCGKSTVMQEMRKREKESDYYINFDDDRLVQFDLVDFQKLLECFIELYGIQGTYFFDEIQNIEGWERFVRRLYDQGNKIYITGSNATMFSRELGTRLTGRYVQVEMFPYSFLEYLRYTNPDLLDLSVYTTQQKGQLLRLFSQYTIQGGIPDFVRYQQKDYLHYLYDSVLYRDIISRYHLHNEKAVKELVYFLASNVGKEFSYNGMRKILGLAGASTISDYCSYLEGSYLCFILNRYSHSLKKQILSNKKCYIVDHALAKEIGFRPTEDRGRLLENLVFIELMRRCEQVYFHKEKKECDFILRSDGKIHGAIQVCCKLESSETRKREIEGVVRGNASLFIKERVDIM